MLRRFKIQMAHVPHGHVRQAWAGVKGDAATAQEPKTPTAGEPVSYNHWSSTPVRAYLPARCSIVLGQELWRSFRKCPGRTIATTKPGVARRDHQLEGETTTEPLTNNYQCRPNQSSNNTDFILESAPSSRLHGHTRRIHDSLGLWPGGAPERTRSTKPRLLASCRRRSRRGRCGRNDRRVRRRCVPRFRRRTSHAAMCNKGGEKRRKG